MRCRSVSLSRSHAPDLLLALELVEGGGAEMTPPLEEHGVADKFEPRREFEIGMSEHMLEFVGGNVFGITNLVRVGSEVDISLDEENVVN